MVPIHPTAIIDRKAELDSTVEVGPYCVIDAHVRVAAGCRLYHGVYLTGWTTIEEDGVLHPGVIVGHEPQDTKYGGERSYCRMGKRAVLREYVTIHRGTIPESETIIGDDCFLLSGSHVAHNCRVGDSVTMITNAGLAGHVTVGDRTTIGGSAGIHQFARVGELAMVAGLARVAMDVPPFALTDAAGRIAGLNRVGMRRAGFTSEEVDDIREAYRFLYARGLPFRAAVEALEHHVVTAPGRRLAEFLLASSQRGIAGRSR